MGYGDNWIRQSRALRVDLLHFLFRGQDQTALQACEVLLICEIAIQRTALAVMYNWKHAATCSLDRALEHGSIESFVERLDR